MDSEEATANDGATGRDGSKSDTDELQQSDDSDGDAISVCSDIIDGNSNLNNCCLEDLDPTLSTDEKIQRVRQDIIDHYKRQHVHQLSQDRAIEVEIWIHPDVSQSWRRTFQTHAIVEINKAAPGLHLHVVADKGRAKIKILQRKDDNHAKTNGNIHISPQVRISVGETRSANLHRRTSVHELLHALGFKHEHQCPSANFQLHVDTNNRQYLPLNGVTRITRFDPYSIMMYTEGEQLRRASVNDPDANSDEDILDIIWADKPKGKRNEDMSELDKVGLNLIYPPCVNDHEHYYPEWNPDTCMFYCFRKVMREHNRPFIDHPISNGICGESRDNPRGPNCPACRTLKGEHLLYDDSRWQGMSGLIYCGKELQEKDVKDKCLVQKSRKSMQCGPDYGLPCNQCWELVYPPKN